MQKHRDIDAIEFDVKEAEERGITDSQNWSQCWMSARREMGKTCGLASKLVSLRSWEWRVQDGAEKPREDDSGLNQGKEGIAIKEDTSEEMRGSFFFKQTLIFFQQLPDSDLC